jgi:hypothetical protein
LKILYARYSRERHPHFQMKTVIYEENGIKKVMKQAINPSGSAHVRRILQNYEDLKIHYKEDVLLESIFTGDTLIFEYIEEVSLDQLILEAALTKNKKKFFSYINLYKKFIYEVAKNNYCEFSNTDEFIAFFEKKYPLDGLKSFVLPNIDLNFDNIFGVNDNLKVLDYEWVLPFPVPVEFVVFRAVNTFYYAHYSTMNSFVDIDELFELFDIPSERIQHYIDMSIRFANFVGTNQATQEQIKYLKKSIPFKYKEPEIISSQMFISDFDKGSFTEENSTKVEINPDTDTLQFSVNYKANRFRFDPADKKCILLLNSITVYDESNNAFIVNEISSNAILSTNSTYLFVTDDPQLYFEIESSLIASKIVISLRYVHFFEDEFFHELGKSYVELMNNNVFLTNSIEQNRNIFDQKALIYQSEIEEKKLLLQEYQNTNVKLKDEMKGLQYKLSEQLDINESLSNEKSHFLSLIENLQTELIAKEQFINSIKNTYWWKATRKIKGFIEKIKSGLKGKKK